MLALKHKQSQSHHPSILCIHLFCWSHKLPLAFTSICATCIHCPSNLKSLTTRRRGIRAAVRGFSEATHIRAGPFDKPSTFALHPADRFCPKRTGLRLRAQSRRAGFLGHPHSSTLVQCQRCSAPPRPSLGSRSLACPAATRPPRVEGCSTVGQLDLPLPTCIVHEPGDPRLRSARVATAARTPKLYSIQPASSSVSPDTTKPSYTHTGRRLVDSVFRPLHLPPAIPFPAASARSHVTRQKSRRAKGPVWHHCSHIRWASRPSATTTGTCLFSFSVARVPSSLTLVLLRR